MIFLRDYSRKIGGRVVKGFAGRPVPESILKGYKKEELDELKKAGIIGENTPEKKESAGK